jgi:hypothetical protein
MFQFKNAGLGMNEPDKSNALPNTFGKVRTFKEDLENFEKGTPTKELSEETADLPSVDQKSIIENASPRQEPPHAFSAAPEVEYSPNNPFQSIPTPPPISSPGSSANSNTQLPPFKSSPSQSFFSEKKASKESFSPEKAGNNQHLPQKKSKSGLVLTLVVALVVAATGAGFYYYWFNIKNTSPAAPAVPVSSTAPQAETPTSAESQNKNLKNIVVDTSSPSGIIDAIQKFANDFANSASDGNLTEAKLLDKDNQPISKDNFFTELIGLAGGAPNGVTMKLSEDYSLFAKKEGGTVKLGLVFKTVTSSGLADEMKNWEPTIALDLGSLYLGQAPSPSQAAFNSSRYKNADIRYFNFSSPADTSLDYSVISNFLVIGSSKDTTRDILDYMSQK